MNTLVTTRIALRALAKNKMRAALTVLGIVIGIAAVTTMVSIGQSAGKLFQGVVEGCWGPMFSLSFKVAVAYTVCVSRALQR